MAGGNSLACRLGRSAKTQNNGRFSKVGMPKTATSNYASKHIYSVTKPLGSHSKYGRGESHKTHRALYWILKLTAVGILTKNNSKIRK